MRLVFADPRSPRTEAAKGTYQSPSVRARRRKGEGDVRGRKDFHRIKFFAASESETGDGLPVGFAFTPRRWIFRRAVDQYYFAGELARNRRGGGGTRSRPRTRDLVYERYMRRWANASMRAHTSSI